MATKAKAPILLQLNPAELVVNKQVRVERNEKADKELLASVKKHGVMQPVQARQIGDKYHLVAGHRRTEAAIAAGLESIPVYVSDVADAEILTRQMVENIQREGLSLLDTAKGVRALHEGPGGGLASYTAERLGKPNSWVSKMLLIAGGDKANPAALTITQKLLATDKLGDLEAAYMLTRLEGIDPAAAKEVADNIGNETRNTIKKRLAAAKPAKKTASEPADGDTEQEAAMWAWVLKVVKAATVSKKDAPLQAAAIEWLESE